MKKKSFEINENEIKDNLLVDESEIVQPLIVEEPDEIQTVASLSSTEEYVKATRNAPEISCDSVSSIKRAIAYYDNLEIKIQDAVIEDAEKSEISLDHLKVLDNTCAAIDMVRSQLKVSAERVGIIKTAKSARFVYTVDPFLFAIARLCINAKVANGKNIEEVYGQCKSIYGIDEREELSLRQIIADMGYPIHNSFVADHESFDMIRQYFG